MGTLIIPHLPTMDPRLAYMRHCQCMRHAQVAENEFSGLVLHCTPEQNCSPGYNGEVRVAVDVISFYVTGAAVAGP